MVTNTRHGGGGGGGISFSRDRGFRSRGTSIYIGTPGSMGGWGGGAGHRYI